MGTLLRQMGNENRARAAVVQLRNRRRCAGCEQQRFPQEKPVGCNLAVEMAEFNDCLCSDVGTQRPREQIFPELMEVAVELMRQGMRSRVAGLLAMVVLLAAPLEVHGWGRGHRLIRLWAVRRIPQWQQTLIGSEPLARLCSDYTSLQDRHAGGNAPELDAYCVVPGVRLSLHDVNPAMASAAGTLWYLDRITDSIRAGDMDEAMKFLGVLCHWNEDPGCPSAHSSPVSEVELRRLLPPPKERENLNYLFGAGGIMDAGTYEIAEVAYQPRLLGTTREEAALRICQHQRLLQRNAAAHIIPIVQSVMYGDGAEAERHRAEAALVNARHTADVIYTVICLAANRLEDGDRHEHTQLLSEWLPEFTGGMIPHPYYVNPFMKDQAMDAGRRLHPLAFAGKGDVQIRGGYGMGTPFSLNYVLAPGSVYDRFSCEVGLHPTAGNEAGVVFVVFANDQELVRTQAMTPASGAVRIDVQLPQDEVLRLSLRTEAVEGSAAVQNLTVWGNPLLHPVR